MIELTGLHLLLTYTCNYQCDHCFVWGSPWQEGTMTLDDVETILAEGEALGTVSSIYFEGGEPYLYYRTMLQGARLAKAMGFSVGIVSNAYWATSVRDATNWLEPFAGLIDDLSMSADAYHGDVTAEAHVSNAEAAAAALDIPTGVIRIARVAAADVPAHMGQLPQAESNVMFRGRAAAALAPQAPHRPWEQFTTCPYEDLRDPGRVHVDPLGNLHLCQGIVLGNLFEEPLATIVARYDPDTHAIAGPLLRGGPVELVRQYNVARADAYADACHLCYEARLELRSRFPAILRPDQMYGAYD
jgi:MoaA/NifB/PqqE/SkfB family radical SAM enzyme